MFTRAQFLRLSSVTAAALAVAPEALSKANDGVVRVKSAYSFQDTVERLKRDIAAKDIRFFSEIDQSKLAADAGIKLNPWQPAARHPIHNGKSKCRHGLAGAAPGDRGQRWRSLDDLYRFCVDRRTARHRQPRRTVQEGINGSCLHHVKRKGLRHEPT